MHGNKGKHRSEETRRKISLAKKGHIAWNKGMKMSKEFCKKDSIAQKKRYKTNPVWNKGKECPQISFSHIGSKNPNWKNGKTKNVGNYVLILKPEHPFCNKEGYIFEHRLVMEKHLGRFLKPKERVHHINGNVQDNHIDNLELFSNESEHQKFHWLLRK